jgi:uncharacterized repeat protein (TIGR01451 family)
LLNTATASAKDEQETPVSDSDQHSTRLLHQAIDIDKTGPATATPGSTVQYTLVVTNTGDTSFAAANVNVTDTLCSPQLAGKADQGGGADPSPDTLNPGDVWSYTCDVQTQPGDTVVDNSASVTGTDEHGRGAQDTDTAQTNLVTQLGAQPTPPQQGVAGGGARSGLAFARGPDGCVRRPFTAYIRGREIRRVTFFLDGRKYRVVSKPNRRGRFNVRVYPTKLKNGPHRLKARVQFTVRSSTRPKTVTITFQRCQRAKPGPAFTG